MTKEGNTSIMETHTRVYFRGEAKGVFVVILIIMVQGGEGGQMTSRIYCTHS